MGLLDFLKKAFNNTTIKDSNVNVSVSSGIFTNNEIPLENSSISKKVRDDYRKTIFLYAESKNSKIKTKKEYVGYLSYECGITNPEIFHKQLIDDGYYVEATLEEKLELLKVNELKELLKNNNLTAKGKKIELIKEIAEKIPSNNISVAKEKYYSLSEKGKMFLQNNENYVDIHRYRDYQISLEDYYNATKNDNYKRKFNDVAWQIFNERTLLYQKNEEFGNLRFNFFHMASLLMRENKEKSALRLYLDCLIIDLSGVESIDCIRSYKSGWCTKKEFLERLEYNWFTNSLIEQIVELKEYYEDEMLSESYNKIYLPFNVSSKEFIQKLLNDAFNLAVLDYEKYKNELIKNKKKKYLEMI